MRLYFVLPSIPLSSLQLISSQRKLLSTHCSHNGLLALMMTAHFHPCYSMGLEYYYPRSQGPLLPIIGDLLNWQRIFRNTVFDHIIPSFPLTT